jgi:hypothetical protein
MTLTTINIEEVKTSVDAALEALQQDLRELNHRVRSSLCLDLICKDSMLMIIRSGPTQSLLTRSTAPMIQFVTSSKDKASPLLAMLMGLKPLLRF